jgi:hypothetical protein
MHHSGQRIVIEVRRAPRYETLIFTASRSIANLPAGHWWLSLSRFRVAPSPMSKIAPTQLAVDCKIEHRQVRHAALQLQLGSD